MKEKLLLPKMPLQGQILFLPLQGHFYLNKQ
jgi:hypothetical protein